MTSLSMLTLSVLLAAGSEPALDAPLTLAPGNAKLQARLQTLPPLRELVSAPFVLATRDLNNDGNDELIVISRHRPRCDDTGCDAMVVEVKDRRVTVLLKNRLGEALAPTREMFGTYRALASLDADGKLRFLPAETGRPAQAMLHLMAGA